MSELHSFFPFLSRCIAFVENLNQPRADEKLNDNLVLRYPKYRNLLLLKVSSVFFVNEYQVEVIPGTEFLVDFAECSNPPRIIG